MDTKYEGWINQSTWAIALKVDNDYVLYRKMMDAPNLEAFVKDQCRNYSDANQAELIAHWKSKRAEAK